MKTDNYTHSDNKKTTTATTSKLRDNKYKEK